MEKHPPYQLHELRALLLRLATTNAVWNSITLPLSYLVRDRSKLQRRPAIFYVNAAAAVAPDDVQQQARLTVEQCRVLDSGGQLLSVQRLDSLELNYPDAPIGVLWELHKQCPNAGPQLEYSTLEQFDQEASAWQRETEELERHAVRLEEEQEQSAAARQARAAVTHRQATVPPPRGFLQCMQKSRLFFHTDKRQRDTTASDEDKSAQFARVNGAWDELNACRLLFQELRGFRAKRKRAAKAAAAANGEDVEEEEEEEVED